MQGHGNNYNCNLLHFCGIIRLLLLVYASNSVTCHFHELIMVQSTT